MKTFIMIMMLCGVLLSQEVPVVKHAVRDERVKFYEKLNKETIENVFSGELNDSTEEAWEGAFWGSELILRNDDLIRNAVKRALSDYKKRSNGFIRASIEAAYTLFPGEFPEIIGEILNSTDNPKIFAMCVNQLVMGGREYSRKYRKIMEDKFTDWNSNPILYSMDYNFEKGLKDLIDKPSIKELVENSFWKDVPVIFSFQRYDRNYPGLAIVKNEKGEIVKNEDGTIFSITQLARAITNLPGYLTNGNTPQGVFSIKGFEVSESYFIGPTENIQIRLPFEDAVFSFFNSWNFIDDEWTLEKYIETLPESWKNYEPMRTAFYAGLAGRNEIIVHGTTIDPEFYKGKSYYPNTPSLGCLCAPERWSEVNGMRVESEQQRLVDVFKRCGSEAGYLVVVELDNEKRAVGIGDILRELK